MILNWMVVSTRISHLTVTPLNEVNARFFVTNHCWQQFSSLPPSPSSSSSFHFHRMFLPLLVFHFIRMLALSLKANFEFLFFFYGLQNACKYSCKWFWDCLSSHTYNIHRLRMRHKRTHWMNINGKKDQRNYAFSTWRPMKPLFLSE